MSAATVYQHPDGPALSYCASELTATDENGNSVRLPIGPLGLSALAAEMLVLANDVGNLAEQHGSAAAIDCLNELLATDSASKRINIIQAAILSLQSATHPERAAGGFAVVLESVIERGLEALK